jgi:hypothetical protein
MGGGFPSFALSHCFFVIGKEYNASASPQPFLGPISGPIMWAHPVWADSMHTTSRKKKRKKKKKEKKIIMLLRKSIEC